MRSMLRALLRYVLFPFNPFPFPCRSTHSLGVNSRARRTPSLSLYVPSLSTHGTLPIDNSLIHPPCPPHDLLTSHPLTHPQSTIGALTGAQAWATSGEQDKNQAIDAMKAAGEKRESGNAPGEGQGIVGGVEEAAGKLVGCEGMKREGAEGKKD